MDRSGKNWEPELFRCTMVGAGNFTTKERMFYETNGYILRKKLIPLDILQRCRIRCSDLCKGETQKGWTRVTMDSTESTWLLIEDVLWDPAFSHLVLHPPLLNAVESITGPNIIATDSIMFPTIGHVSDIAAPFSREFDQIRIRPEHRIACTWTVVDNFNEEKRSLSIIPGTHKKIANPEEYDDDGKALFDFQIIDLELDIGDTLIFHPLIFKAPITSAKNNKQILAINYASSNCSIFVDKSKTEMKALPFEIILEDFWNLRFRLVRGIFSQFVGSLKSKY